MHVVDASMEHSGTLDHALVVKHTIHDANEERLPLMGVNLNL